MMNEWGGILFCFCWVDRKSDWWLRRELRRKWNGVWKIHCRQVSLLESYEYDFGKSKKKIEMRRLRKIWPIFHALQYVHQKIFSISPQITLYYRVHFVQVFSVIYLFIIIMNNVSFHTEYHLPHMIMATISLTNIVISDFQATFNFNKSLLSVALIVKI